MDPSRILAGLAFVGLVPALIYLSYRGAAAGLYPTITIPIVFGLVLVASLVVLFAGLPLLRKLLG